MLFCRYAVYLVKDASRPVAAESDALALIDMDAKGVHIIHSADVGEILKQQTGGSGIVMSFVITLTIMSSFSMTFSSY